MAKVTKNIVDKDLREKVFEDLMDFTSGGSDYDYTKINDRQYGVLITDLNGVQRYCRIGVIVAEEREDMTAEELMQSEIAAYNAKQADKEAKAQARAEKAKKDKEERERKQKIIEAEKKVVESIGAKEKEEKENA